MYFDSNSNSNSFSTPSHPPYNPHQSTVNNLTSEIDELYYENEALKKKNKQFKRKYKKLKKLLKKEKQFFSATVQSITLSINELFPTLLNEDVNENNIYLGLLKTLQHNQPSSQRSYKQLKVALISKLLVENNRGKNSCSDSSDDSSSESDSD